MTTRRDEGAALLMVLVVMALFMAMGLGLAAIAVAELAMGGAARSDLMLRSAVDAAAERALHDLGALPSWTSALNGSALSSFSGGPMVVEVSPGRTVNLTALTTSLQAQSDAYVRLGPNGPRWRLFAWGWLHEAIGEFAAAGLPFTAVWVFDDWSETDTDPETDSNGRLGVRAMAFGASGGERAVDLRIAQITNPVGVKVLAWRSMQ
jgi:hypothetical protein